MIVLLALLLVLVPFRLTAQVPAGEIVVSVTDASDAGTESYLNGYRAALDGQTILYHSSHPDAEAALIVRANSAAHEAAWVTDTIPPHGDGETVQFIWLAGLERSGWGESKNGHPFELSVDGERWFTFRNYKDSSAAAWTVRGPGGATLSFTARKADKFGDQFGTMLLRVPGALAPAGRALTIRVTGEPAESPEWFMAFQYRFSFTPRVRVEPALFRSEKGETQVLRLSLDNLRQGKSVEVTSAEGTRLSGALAVGGNTFLLPIAAVERPVDRTLRFVVNGRELARTSVSVAPVRRREVYLLSHSHNDIGYTTVQPEVEQKQWANIDLALRLVAATRAYPPEAQFRWNIEVLWPLESWFRNASPARREEFLAAVRSGHIGLNALFANVLTGLATGPEMGHFTDFARAFAAEHGVPVTTALVSDIPGFSWGIVPALAQAGVRYFASGPNSGDRIGYVLEAWGDKPFYWTSQSGTDSVLFWVAGAGYSSFHEGTLSSLGDEKLMKMMRRLDDSGYPYAMVQMPYTQGDNGPPDTTLSDYVRRWNETYSSPRLVIATHRQMFEEFERQVGSELPSHGGDFTPYWEDGAFSSASESILNRRAVDALAAGEALWSMRAPKAYPAGEYLAAWRNVVLWDEHTWGADKSVTDPDDPGVKEQWRIKRQFALDADSMARGLLRAAAAAPAPAFTGAIDVVNPSGWDRTGVVIVPADLSKERDEVLDERGRPLPSQRLADGSLAVASGRCEPFSSRRWTLRVKPARGGAARAAEAPNVLENALVRVVVDTSSGSITELRWKKGGGNLAGGGLGAYVYVPGTNPDSALGLRNVRVRSGESGRVFRSVVVTAEAPGCRSYRTEIRLAEGSDRVEITTTLDKIAVRTKEGVHVAFPFNLPGALVRYDVAGAIVRPEADQLAGACKNFFSTRSWIDVSTPETGVTVALPDVPLVEIGAITAEKPWIRSTASSPTVYSYVMNNYWHTNYKADQEGIVAFRYVLRPHGPFDPEAAARLGGECRAPLLVAAAGSRQASGALVRSAASGTLIESIRPAGDGWLLYLTNPTGTASPIDLRWGGGRSVQLSESGPSGLTGRPLPARPVLSPGQSMYLLARETK